MVGSSEVETFNYKIVLIGDSSVGKTTLRRNFMGESFDENYSSTLMADFASHDLDMDTYKVNFQIWDLAGQPGFKDVRTRYYYGAFGALIVFDVTEPSSFENLDTWIDQLKMATMSNGTPIVVVANKIDLGDEVKVDFDKVDNFVEQLREEYKYEVNYIKTSAKTGENVEKAFELIADSIHRWKTSE